MPRRKLEDRSVRSLNKTSGGKSYSVTLPVELIRLFRWKSKQKLTVKADRKRQRIVLEDWKG